MKWKAGFVFLLLALTVSCGAKFYDPGTRSSGEDNSGPGESPSDGVPAVDISGNYDILSMKFDSDPGAEFDTSSVVTNVVRNVYGTVDGNGFFLRASIREGYLKIYSDGTYSIYYRFMNENDDVVEVGKFSEGYQHGTYEVSGSTVSFYPQDGTPGFAHAADSQYTAKLELGNLVMDAAGASVDEMFLKSIKAKRKL